MKMFRTAASLMLLSALMIASAVDMRATSRFGVDLIHSFAGGADGANPYATLVRATDGYLYGTTSGGGTANLGTVFKMTVGGTETILHSFAGGAEGASPFAPLIQATDGNLYGTTYFGGPSNMGTVFRVTPAGVMSTIYVFAGGVDGANPRAALLQTTDGNLYGTTQFGGTANRGTLFAINTAGAVVGRYTFTGGFDGAYPYASLIQATDGNLYGTNYGGTISTFGRVFKLVGGVITVLHTFASGAADGANPGAGLVQGTDGNFYGTTLFGGASNNGTAFKMTPAGAVTILNSFTGGFDGANPSAALIQTAGGSFYGTARVGASGYGTVFKINPAGALTVLHTFTGGADGADSSAALFKATANGKIYGTTSFGGESGFGLVFRLPSSTPGDFDGDGKADITIFRPSTGTWWIDGSSASSTDVWGEAGDVPVAGDYDGDGKADVAVFRPSNGTWYIRYSSGVSLPAPVWGGTGDIPVPGDYDGDGLTDVVVFRPSTGTWYIDYSSGVSLPAPVWGGTGDIPVPGDYDGDGITDVAIFRPSTGTWYIKYSSGVSLPAPVWGGTGDIPVPGDYDGDGITDVAIFRPSTGTWYIKYSSGASIPAPVWGGAGDIPVPGDYSGNGTTAIAVFRPSSGAWLFRASPAVSWGANGDIPILKAPAVN
jgi:uncharacterized repeat protein (TIGR03803 family)